MAGGNCVCAPYANGIRAAGAFPVLFITGQKPILKSKQGAFQIVDIIKLFHNVTKFCKQVRSTPPCCAGMQP